MSVPVVTEEDDKRQQEWIDALDREAREYLIRGLPFPATLYQAVRHLLDRAG